MSSTSPRRTSICPSEVQGLQLDRFLHTLDWASESHPQTTSQHSCLACKSHRQGSASDELPISIDHLKGHARFCIGGRHQIAFSPFDTGGGPLCQIPTVLSIEDGALHLALTAGPEGRKRCLAVNLGKLVSGPELSHTKDTLCLEFAFPFVSLLIERSRRDSNDTSHETARTRELQFGAMKEAIVELHDMPSSSDPSKAGQQQDKKIDKDGSLFNVALGRILEQETMKKMSLDGAFTHLMNQGAEMAMPLCFPYNRRTVPPSAVGNTRADHAAFVDAYMNQEAIWTRTMKQVDAALYFAKRRSGKEKEKGEKDTGGANETERVEAFDGAPKPS